MAQRFENWRILPELHREIGIASKEQDVPMYELARLAWDAYLGRDRAKAHQHSGDPATTPTDPHERAVVAAALAFHREHDLPEEFREILFVLLKRWLPKGFKFNSGKKTA